MEIDNGAETYKPRKPVLNVNGISIDGLVLVHLQPQPRIRPARPIIPFIKRRPTSKEAKTPPANPAATKVKTFVSMVKPLSTRLLKRDFH
ncbi:hypothetical protein FLX56_28355 [Synechococcus moorigangaii CMS01]|nr:hypothetical protein [Synechococcus moorigangaii CMS01]